jgi:hypothetical protein
MRFVKNGQFNTGSFIAHVAIRPWLWPAVIKLARSSALASKVLSEALANPKFGAAHTETLVGSKA